jgi:16S rRNA (cytosine1402-N4)-methyltransferase
MAHIPVLQQEVLRYLDPKPNENFIDCTIGEGGHSSAILEKIAPRGKILGIDFQLRLKPRERLILTEDNFANLSSIVEKYKFKRVDGILFDLGMSSWHLEESSRGFSFKRGGPLDMRYDVKGVLTAEKILNYWSRFELARIFQDYGEERKSERIAEEIIETRKHKPIINTLQLGEIIKKAGGSLQQSFQALRIAVNNELDNLRLALPAAEEILSPGGRLAAISFHSLEDRIVKDFLKAQSGEMQILTKKPVTASPAEIKLNPRSRSAKLRSAEKL